MLNRLNRLRLAQKLKNKDKKKNLVGQQNFCGVIEKHLKTMRYDLNLDFLILQNTEKPGPPLVEGNT